MSASALLVAQVTLILAASLASVAMAPRASAAWRHWVLACAVIVALGLPAVALVAPRWGGVPVTAPAGEVEVLSTVTLPVPVAASRATPPATASRLPGLLPTFWLLGSVITACPLLVGYGRLRRISRQSRDAGGAWPAQVSAAAAARGVRSSLRLRETSHPALLVAWGWRRLEILLPAGASTWPADRVHLIATHEIAHLARRDVPAFALADLLRVVYWFHPLAWLVCRRLKDESERACDDEVLRSGAVSADYAAELVAIARSFAVRRAPAVPAPAIARPSTLQRRVRAMLNVSIDRRPLSRRAQVACLAGAFAVAVPIAGYGRQAVSSQVSGTVTDPAGLPMPEVVVRLSSVLRDLAVETKTDVNGRYDVLLEPGTYKVEARHPGFRIETLDVTVASGLPTHKSIALALGTVRETIHVTKDAASSAAPRPGIAAKSTELARCSPSGSGGQVNPPLKVRDVHPIFPDGEPAQGQPVVVPLSARIAADGSVQDVTTTAQAPPDFEAAAVAAVRQWQFTPTLLNCQPTDVTMNVSITFRPAR